MNDENKLPIHQLILEFNLFFSLFRSMHTISIKLCFGENFLNAINWDFGGEIEMARERSVDLAASKRKASLG